MENYQAVRTQGARCNVSEDCIVLLEELISSNRDLAEENARLRQEHERASQQHADALKRIERRLDDGENVSAEKSMSPKKGQHRQYRSSFFMSSK